MRLFHSNTMLRIIQERGNYFKVDAYEKLVRHNKQSKAECNGGHDNNSNETKVTVDVE